MDTKFRKNTILISYLMLKNAGFTAFTNSELLWKNQQEEDGKTTSPLDES